MFSAGKGACSKEENHSSYTFMIYAFFVIKKFFFEGPIHPRFPTFHSHTFRSQDALDLLQEGLVHKRWGWTTHSQCWVLTVHIKHYHVVLRPCWERGAKEFLPLLDKIRPLTFLHCISPVTCGGRRWLSQEDDREDVHVKATDITIQRNRHQGSAVSAPP